MGGGGRGGHGGGGGGRHGGGHHFGGARHGGGHVGGGHHPGPMIPRGPHGFHFIPVHIRRPPPLSISPLEVLPPVYFNIENEEYDRLMKEETSDRAKYLYFEIYLDQPGPIASLFSCFFPTKQYYMKMRNPETCKTSMDQRMPTPIFIERTFTPSESFCCPHVDDQKRVEEIPEWVEFARKKWDEFVPEQQTPPPPVQGFETPQPLDNPVSFPTDSGNQEMEPILNEEPKKTNYDYPASS